MVFSSMFFLWVFLPIAMIGYYLAKDDYKNIFLLFASLVFYAWGEPTYIFLMLLSITVNWLLALLLERYISARTMIFVIDICFNVILLGYYKYFNFLVEIINNIFHKSFVKNDIALPIGISFFTFQILSYIIDLYRREYKAQKSIVNMALYISFFPQLIAGPIVKYKEINSQLNKRIFTMNKMAQGIRRFIYGLGKKVIIANILAKNVDYLYAQNPLELAGWMAWIGSIFYTLQIYFDFSGYSDMAIGLGKIFGFDFLENFNYPYVSHSIQDFWRRWHISLSTWFKEYVYIPLGGNRKGKVRTYINLLIVFLITGLWHGAGITFILWGLYHGMFLIFERLGFNKFLDKHKFFGHIYTLIIVNFGWVLFRANTLLQAKVLIKRMIVPWNYVNSAIVWQEVFSSYSIFIALLGLIGCGFLQVWIPKWKYTDSLKYSIPELAFCSGIFIMCISMLAGNAYNPFIYFRF